MLPNLPKCRVWAFELAVPGLRAVTHHPRTTSLRVLDHCCAQPGRRLFRQQTERAHRACVPILIKDEVRLRRPRVKVGAANKPRNHFLPVGPIPRLLGWKPITFRLSGYPERSKERNVFSMNCNIENDAIVILRLRRNDHAR